MATLQLTKVFVTLISTGVSVAAQSTERGVQHDIAGDVKTYAGGRRRFIGQEGVRGQFSFRLLLLTLTQVETLESWMGQPVLVRDRRGQAFTGVFKQVTRSEYKDATKYNAAVVAEFVTVADGV